MLPLPDPRWCELDPHVSPRSSWFWFKHVAGRILCELFHPGYLKYLFVTWTCPFWNRWGPTNNTLMSQAFLVDATQGVAPRTFYVSEFPQAALKQGGNRSSLPCFNPLLVVNAACCTCKQLHRGQWFLSAGRLQVAISHQLNTPTPGSLAEEEPEIWTTRDEERRLEISYCWWKGLITCPLQHLFIRCPFTWRAAAGLS